MNSFVFVKHEKVKPAREKLEKMILELQTEVKPFINFQYMISSAAGNNMITCDRIRNIGFDFEYDLLPHCDFRKYPPDQIIRILRDGLSRLCDRYSYKLYDDYDGVISLKQITDPEIYFNCPIYHSCDFLICRRSGHPQIISYDKKANIYFWENQPEDYDDLQEKIDYLRSINQWTAVRHKYINLKNNDDIGLRSRFLLLKAVNFVFDEFK